MGRSWSSSIFRLPEFDFPDWIRPSSIFRWPEFDFTGLRTNWAHMYLDLSIVDTVVWSFITVVESFALVAMLCFFFICCGCCSL
ncbi:hypothetical protein AAC387_Pa10g2058 [Persea americana]